MNVATYLARQLAQWGVERVYGLVGDAVLDFVDALKTASRPRFVPVTHESAAAFMASAEAKLTGRPACCVATSGPGAANLINGVADADRDRAPVLAITGQVERSRIGTDRKQYVDQPRLFSAVSAFSATVASEQALALVLPLAWRAMVGQGRAAHLSIPKDLWRLEVAAPVRPPEPFLATRPQASPDALVGAVSLMERATRPVIVCGHGARPAREAIIALAERWQAAVVRSLGGIGVVPGNHPLAVGGFGEGGTSAGHAVLRRADLALVIGSTWWPPEYVPRTLAVVQVDRQPASIGRDMEVAHGVVGETADVVPALAETVRPAHRPEWLGEIEALRRQWQARAEELARPGPVPLAPAYVVRELERVLAPDAVVALDVGDHVLWFNQFFEGTSHRVLVSGTWRSMGFALPAATAAWLCDPARQVVALTGDGGLLLSAGELLTAARLDARLLLIVADNGWLAMEKNRMEAAGLSTEPARLRNFDFVRLSEAAGVRAWRVTGAGALAPVLQEAAAASGPALVDVPVSADPPPAPEVLP